MNTFNETPPNPMVFKGSTDLVLRLSAKISAAKDKWLEKIMSRCVSKRTARLARSKKLKPRHRAAQLIKRAGYMLREYPDHTELWQRDKFLGEFRVAVKDGQVTVTERIAP